MARPRDIGVIDTLIGFRGVRQVAHVAAAKDQGVRHPAEYMFKAIPEELSAEADRYAAIDDTVAEMDRHGVRGSDKVIYGGYFRYGIERERTFREMDDVPFKPEVWPKFLRDNAARVLGLEPVA